MNQVINKYSFENSKRILERSNEIRRLADALLNGFDISQKELTSKINKALYDFAEKYGLSLYELCFRTKPVVNKRTEYNAKDPLMTVKDIDYEVLLEPVELELEKDGDYWKEKYYRQKENLWKSADGDDLPEIDRDVIALLDNGKVVFAHRPPEYWDGKDIITGKVTRNYPKTYDKGGWNIPNVKYWLDVELPKEIDYE